MRRSRIVFTCAVATVCAGVIVATAASQHQRSGPAVAASGSRPLCTEDASTCTETVDPIGYEGAYTGHDEPAVLFYSRTKGSGNSNFYQLTIPTDAQVPPQQNGNGGTDNFQLHPAFWFGMAMCDSESAPEYTHVCNPDTDNNIYNSGNPESPRYIGKHPGTAFMEMQFYPPGWLQWPPGDSCDPTRWCAALNIDSFSEDMNTGAVNNGGCLNTVGIEPVNFAFLTISGHSHAPADPVSFATNPATGTPNPATDLFMNSGDRLIVGMYDTPDGFQVTVNDTTTGQVGSMTASKANGFGQIKFDPNGNGCTVIPYAFHPMYATSRTNTRVPWAAHSYNVAFSDEIGHFEYCSSVDDGPGSSCIDDPNDPAEGDFGDDSYCFLAGTFPNVNLGGCLGTDDDFDGVPYQRVWPGTGGDATKKPGPIEFTSPLFFNGGGLQDYDRAAFETDLPRIEFATNPPCNRSTGANCVNPPVGANFYPIYSIGRRSGDNACVWHEGGRSIPGTTLAFGGTSTAEFGGLLRSTYPGVGFTPIHRFNNFRNILDFNPCSGFSGSANGSIFASVGGPAATG